MTLRPCPFCGAPAEIRENATVLVKCTKCTAAVFQRLRDPKSAIRMWNRRALQHEKGKSESRDA